MRFMRLPLYVGFGITFAAAVANAETSAAPSQSDHHFLLEFQETAIEELDPIRDRLISKGFIAETLANIESQIALPRDVPVTFRDCGFANAGWDEKEHTGITYCYELFQKYATGYEDVEGKESASLEGADRDTVLTAVTLFILMHELGHAAIDLFDLPATGRQEDAADQLAALLLIRQDEKGEPVLERPSRMALIAAYYYKQTGIDPALHPVVLADVHGLGDQRYYDTMCLVYGSDPEAYRPLLMPGATMVSELMETDPGKLDSDTAAKVDTVMRAVDSLNILPLHRAQTCEMEYRIYSTAWDNLIKTYILKHE